MSEQERARTRTQEGVVVSNAMDKTIVVVVKRKIRHARYGKYVTVHKRFMAHDEANTCEVGDLVVIAESRRLSKSKRWRLRQVVERAITDSPDVAEVSAIPEVGEAK
jgi:small subunit ribosomal protein S17